jgi:hypothetical protein
LKIKNNNKSFEREECDKNCSSKTSKSLKTSWTSFSTITINSGYYRLIEAMIPSPKIEGFELDFFLITQESVYFFNERSDGQFAKMEFEIYIKYYFVFI